MHSTKKIFVIAIIVFLLVAGVAQAVQLSTWTGSDIVGAQVEQVAKYIQTAALYAFTPLAVAGYLWCCHSEKGDRVRTGLAESSY